MKYDLIDPEDASATMLAIEMPRAAKWRRAQLAAMFAVLATAIVGYVSIVA